MGSNSADVNHPFSYSGLDIDQLNAARAVQRNADLLQLFSQPPAVVQQAVAPDTLTQLRLQMQVDVNAQTQINISSPAMLPSPSYIPIQNSLDARLNALKAYLQRLMPEGDR